MAETTADSQWEWRMAMTTEATRDKEVRLEAARATTCVSTNAKPDLWRAVCVADLELTMPVQLE